MYPSLLSVRAREETQQPLEENHSTLKISGTDKVLSTSESRLSLCCGSIYVSLRDIYDCHLLPEGLPLGPDQEVLKEVMSLMQAEKLVLPPSMLVILPLGRPTSPSDCDCFLSGQRNIGLVPSVCSQPVNHGILRESSTCSVSSAAS